MSKWDDHFIELAALVSTWSKDPSTQVGAVAASSEHQVLSIGFNGLPRGIEDTTDRLENRVVKYQNMVHAEANCIYNAATNGVKLKDATMYVYGLPVCCECAKALIQSGISRVVWSSTRQGKIPSKWRESYIHTTELFDECGITIIEYDNEKN